MIHSIPVEATINGDIHNSTESPPEHSKSACDVLLQH